MLKVDLTGQEPRDPAAILREFIDNGQLSLQDRLPPERELSEMLKISRAALRKALAVLESEGRIWRHVGRGTFVGPPPEPESIKTLTVATNPSEIMEARLCLEPRLAALAALRVTLKELSDMELCLRRTKEVTTTAEYEYWDSQFHETIAKSTKNALLLSLFEMINSVRKDEIWGRLKDSTVTPKRRSLYYRQHSDLIDALRDRDTVHAEMLMREHIETVQKHLLTYPK